MNDREQLLEAPVLTYDEFVTLFPEYAYIAFQNKPANSTIIFFKIKDVVTMFGEYGMYYAYPTWERKELNYEKQLADIVVDYDIVYSVYNLLNSHEEAILAGLIEGLSPIKLSTLSFLIESINSGTFILDNGEI